MNRTNKKRHHVPQKNKIYIQTHNKIWQKETKFCDQFFFVWIGVYGVCSKSKYSNVLKSRATNS